MNTSPHTLLYPFFFLLMLSGCSSIYAGTTNPLDGIPMYYWDELFYTNNSGKTNFGDYLSVKIVERIVNGPVKVIPKQMLNKTEKKLLALGSILLFGRENDVVWGTGTNGKNPNRGNYRFSHLDVRAVRGPLTREFLWMTFNIECPEIYGDPALLVPYLFPEFKKQQNPSQDFILIPNFADEKLFPKEEYPFVVYATEPWDEVITKILDSKFVISSSLHGIIIAEAFGIPARYLRVTDKEPLLKYQDYYLSTNRPCFEYATSIEEALQMGGEPPIECDLEKLYDAFPFDYWPQSTFTKPNFPKKSVSYESKI